MNSLKIVSARVIGTPSPSPAQSRSASFRDLTKAAPSRPILQTRKTTSEDEPSEKSLFQEQDDSAIDDGKVEAESDDVSAVDEKSPLIPKDDSPKSVAKSSRWSLIPQRIFDALVESLKWVLSTLAAPGIFVASAFYDETGRFTISGPLKRVYKAMARRRATTSGAHSSSTSGKKTGRKRKESESKSSSRSPSLEASSSSLSSDSEAEQNEDLLTGTESPASNTRSKTTEVASASDAGSKSKRSIRIKVSSSDTQKSSRSKKSKGQQSDSSNQAISPDLLKSPTASSTSRLMTKYPHAPAPPRPLIPRLQPTYSVPTPSEPNLIRKTLILDLDETLIHSMAKGGRMSTGHMVEVKLNTAVGMGPTVTLAPQHPILYYVHKRPHCDEFLKRVSQWYKLVVFTASVQEYADPVIDWLEQDRKYFSGRFYRQHCTFRQGTYIKDLSAVEPDLSKVMIVDNSPTSYVFHEDNALPIEGWINDPTDNDLLHLVPLLEALQYTTDVRALLALRMGEVTA